MFNLDVWIFSTLCGLAAYSVWCFVVEFFVSRSRARARRAAEFRNREGL
jgi:hypothetical protein